MREREDSGRKFTGDLVDFQSEEILDLRAGDDDCNTVGETNDDGAGDKLNRRTQAGGAQDQEQYASQQGTHEQPIHTVFRDNAINDDDECAGWTTDLG